MNHPDVSSEIHTWVPPPEPQLLFREIGRAPVVDVGEPNELEDLEDVVERRPTNREAGWRLRKGDVRLRRRAHASGDGSAEGPHWRASAPCGEGWALGGQSQGFAL